MENEAIIFHEEKEGHKTIVHTIDGILLRILTIVCMCLETKC
jgi:hypothetical protein